MVCGPTTAASQGEPGLGVLTNRSGTLRRILEGAQVPPPKTKQKMMRPMWQTWLFMSGA